MKKIILSFSLRSADMVSFPETNDDPTSRLITGGRAKNDAFKFTVALQRSSNWDVKNGADKGAVNHQVNK